MDKQKDVVLIRALFTLLKGLKGSSYTPFPEEVCKKFLRFFKSKI
jgi:hypothetical protein